MELTNKTPSNANNESFASQPTLKLYKKNLYQNIFFGFVICLLIVCERVFRSFTNSSELDLLSKVQEKVETPFNLNPDFSEFYKVIGYIGDFKFYCLIMIHLFISIYVSIDAIIGLKCLFVHSISLYILTLLELIYQGPRPFWVSSQNLITFYCDNSFTNPSVITFGFFFDGSYLLSLYLKKAKEMKLLERVNLDEDIQEEEENHDKITLLLKCVVFIGILLAHILILLRYIIGLLFIVDYIMALVYFALCFTLVRYFDFYIDKLVKSSTLLKKKARGLVFFWIVFLILAILLAYIIYLCCDKILPTFWMDNYVNKILIFILF